MKVERRPATLADEDFARGVHRAGYRNVVVRQFGRWDESQQKSFFAAKWCPEKYQILVCEGRPCGYLHVEERDDAVEIVEIVILPDYQGRGFGTEVLREEVARARSRHVPVILQVLRENRAVSLYARLGFVEYGRTDTHALMRWDINPSATGTR